MMDFGEITVGRSAQRYKVVVFLPQSIVDDERFFIRISSTGAEVKWINNFNFDNYHRPNPTMVIGVDIV
jgi:hypothetical protein